MTVDEILRALQGAFPAFNAKAMETWAPVFRARFNRHEGPALRDAHIAALGAFKPSGRTPFPIPHDYEPHLPANVVKLPKNTKKLDFLGHHRRAQDIFADWRARQGLKASKGVAEVMRALEDVARPLAGIEAWKDEPGRLILDRAKLTIAKKIAVSIQRRIEHGPPSKDAEVWWQQTAAVQERWGVELQRSDWEPAPAPKRESRVRKAGAAA